MSTESKPPVDPAPSALRCYPMPVLVRLYNAGYQAGHHDTVEGGFVDVHPSDSETYHSEEVAEIIAELSNG